MTYSTPSPTKAHNETPLDDMMAAVRLIAGFLYGFGIVLVVILLLVVLAATSLEAASDMPFKMAVGKVFFGTSSGTLGAGLVLLGVLLRDMRLYRLRFGRLAPALQSA